MQRAGLALAIALVGCSPRSSTQPRSASSTQARAATGSNVVADEITNLDKTVRALIEAGKHQEAFPLAERSLALREQKLGPHHADVAISLGNLGEIYLEQRAYERVEQLSRRALDLREKALGAMHPDVAESLNNVAFLYKMQGAYARAEPLFLRAIDIWEKARVTVTTQSALAQSLHNLASLYVAQGAYARAEPIHLRALDLREEALGAMHPEVAESLNDLGLLYQAQGAYARAEPLLIRSLEIVEKARGATHPATAASLNNLSSIYYGQGAYTRAETLLVRVLDLQEKALGPTHPLVVTALNNLAGIYKVQGVYASAEHLWSRVLDIQEKALGPTHPTVAASLNNLAIVHVDRGAYARAEPLYLRALDIHEKALGASHPTVATSLHNLANLYKAQGAYARAEPLFRRALDIREKALGAAHPSVAISLNGLAHLHEARGEYAQAESLFRRALAVGEKAQGATHPDVAVTVANLAMLHVARRAYARAEPLFHRALEINEKALGASHPNIAYCLSGLAFVYQARGAYAQAEPLRLRALEIIEQAFGTMHPHFAQSLESLASLHRAQGAYARAEPLLARVAELRETRLRIELTHLSESRKRDLLSLLLGDSERLVSLHAHEIPTSPRALELALTAILRRKSRVLDSLVDTQAILRAHLTPQLRDKLAQLADVSTRLSTRLRAPFNPRTAENQRAEIATLRARIDGLEAELNQASVEFRVQTEPVTIAKIQAAMPRGSTLVEFVRYHRFDLQQDRALGRWKEERYLAYILPWQGPPQWIALGDAARIDAGVDAMLATMRKDASASAAKAALRNLDALVFAPIRSRLSGVSHVILSPDGKLNLVPFEALIDPQGHHALERQLLSYVTSGRDLLRLAVRQASRSPATIIADPDYGPAGKAYLRVDGTRAETYGRLGGTRVEASQIQAYFADTRTLAGGQATKAALAAVVGPSVLHVATHGFYVRRAATPVPPRPAARERGMSVQGATPPPPSSSGDPTEALDRAGLALAGANADPDGIVSARELAAHDWWGTQLVVLSACGTGVGAVYSGEGVYGMRRALVLAGSRSQVVSLWNVNDSSAPELMRELYGELARGTGRAEALRRAKLRLLQRPRFAHPYYWAAFIQAGDWTPLDQGILREPVPVSTPAPPAAATP